MRIVVGFLFIGFLTLVFFDCKQEERPKAKPIFTALAAEQSGIDFVNELRDSAEQNILDYLYFYNGGGIAVADFDNDGLPDIYLSANQQKNQLYWNKGKLTFQKADAQAGVAGTSNWNTGVTTVDINNDGWLDIYLCAVTGLPGFQGRNELFVNNQDGTFTEAAEQYGLDIQSFATHAGFVDYDRDGDLDLFLLNHAVHSEDSYGKAETRRLPNAQSGDKLFQNNNGLFEEVTQKAQIFSGANGYGLDFAFSDFNNDGWPDLYVGNDFHEDDYLYINQQDGTFQNQAKLSLSHTSKFTMGVVANDFNSDGFTDVFTVDMLPNSEKVLKSSANDDSPQIQELRTQQFGYGYQYARNHLQVNQGAKYFSEQALLHQIEATDWSWSALAADFNADTFTDLYVSNGIPKRPNDLDYLKYLSNPEIRKSLNEKGKIDAKVIDKMPAAVLPNAVFQGTDSTFVARTSEWIKPDSTVTTAATYADLDRDGDLDLILNHINRTTEILENTTQTGGKFTAIDLVFSTKNKSAIGAKITVQTEQKNLYTEIFPNQGFQSSTECHVLFAVAPEDIRSVSVRWPNGKTQSFYGLSQINTLTYDASQVEEEKVRTPKPFFVPVPAPEFVHLENGVTDFDRNKLIPYTLSQMGPALAIGDINGDGREDIFVGSAKDQKAMLFLQSANGTFSLSEKPLFDKRNEEVAAAIVAGNRQRAAQLWVATGGSEYAGAVQPLLDLIWEDGNARPLSDVFTNASVLEVVDFDSDGKMDVFVGQAYHQNDFARRQKSYLFRNTGTEFVLHQSIDNSGFLRSVEWFDFNSDGEMDMLEVGEWSGPQVWLQKKGKFQRADKFFGTDNLNGLWRSSQLFDIDKDGDLDIMLGNWGVNSKFRAAAGESMRMYVADFDQNGQAEPLISIHKSGQDFPFVSYDELAAQMPGIMRMNFTTYKDFAGLPMGKIWDLDAAHKFALQELRSGFLRNNGNSYVFVPFSQELQLAPLNDFLEIDAPNGKAVVAVGNFHGVTPYQGRLDGFNGAILYEENVIISGSETGFSVFDKTVNGIRLVRTEKGNFIILGVNNDAWQWYKINKDE